MSTKRCIETKRGDAYLAKFDDDKDYRSVGACLIAAD